MKKLASKVAHNRPRPFYSTVQPRQQPTAQNWFSWCFILFPRLPERFNFAHRNSFFMSHVISLWLVRTCNLQVLTSRREMSFELKGNANLIRYSDLCISLLITKKIKLLEPGIEPGTFGVWSQDSTTELTFLWWK